MTYWARKCDPDVFAACLTKAGAFCGNVIPFVRESYLRKELHEFLKKGPIEWRIFFAVYATYPSEDRVLRHHAALRAYMFAYWFRLGYFPHFHNAQRGHFRAAAVAAFDVRDRKFSRSYLEYYLDKFCWDDCQRSGDSYMLPRCAETLGRESSDQTRCLLAASHEELFCYRPHLFRDDSQELEEARLLEQKLERMKSRA